MAGRGKGVLRIAIEDFLDTFDLGKLLSKWFVGWGEEQEKAIQLSFSDILDQIDSVEGLPPQLKLGSIIKGRGRAQGAIATMLGFGAQMGMGAASSFLAPVFRLMNYKMDKKILSGRFDPPSAIQIQRRDPSLEKFLDEDIAELGWSETRKKGWKLLLTPLLSEPELLTLYIRKDITELEFAHEMSVKGWNITDVERMKKLRQVIPNVQDLISMAVREAFSDEIARRFEYDNDYPAQLTEWGEKQGLSQAWLQRFWRSHWVLPSPTMAYEMLHRLRPGTTNVPFTVDDMSTLLRTADYPTFFRQRLIETSYSPFTRVDVRRMYKLGILDVNGVKSAYMDIGYNEEKAQALTDFTIKYEVNEQDTPKDEYRVITTGLIREALRKNIIDEGTARSLLAENKYAGDDIDIIIRATQWQAVIQGKPDYQAEYNRELKSAVEKSYTARLSSRDEAVTMLRAINMSDNEIDFTLSLADFIYIESSQADAIKLIGEAYVSKAIDYNRAVIELGKLNITGVQQSKIFSEWDILTTFRTRRLSEAQYRKALNSKLITLDEYKANMVGLGYTDYDIDLLAKLAAGTEEE